MKKTKTTADENNGITVVIPAYGPVTTVNHSVSSALDNYTGNKDDTASMLNIEVLIMADDIEYQKEHDGASQYDYFITKEYQQAYDMTRKSVRVIHNLERYGDHIYQGGGRIFGLYLATYKWIVWFDCDDTLAPSALSEYWDIIRKENPRCPIFRIGNSFLSFDSNGYRKDVGHSIWVQAWCRNRDFYKKFNLTDATIYANKVNRKQGEDYLAEQIACYCFDHNRATEETIKAGDMTKWQEININGGKDSTPCGFWWPNHDSLSRQDIYYGQHLAGSTMSSSMTIINFMKKYNEENGITQQEDEAFKHRLLNMVIYSYFNLADFLKTVSFSNKVHEFNPQAPVGYKPLEQDWILLRDNCAALRKELLTYYDEIQDQDVTDELFRVRHQSDCRCCNVWFGSFQEYMKEEHTILNMDYWAMLDYCSKLDWDNGAVNEIHSKQFTAFIARKNNERPTEKDSV